MSEDAFLSAIQKITTGALSLGDVITAAGELAQTGQTGLATQLYTVWIQFNPGHPQLFVAYFNISGLHTALGDLPTATAALERVIALNPDFLPAQINLGGLVERAGDPVRALAQWTAVLDRMASVTGEAISHKLTALRQIARVMADHHDIAAAEATLRQCLDIGPHQRDVLEQYASLRLGQCKWPVIEPWEGLDRKALMSGVHPLSMSAYTDDPLLHLATSAHHINDLVADPPAGNSADRRHAAIDLTGRRLRIGYVSSDLRDHAVGYLMAEVFELHDKAQVEVFAYYCGIPGQDALKTRTQAAVEHWVEIRELSDDAAAQRIADDGIDILIDVNGHTRDSRTGVFARRPAPIQVNWLGFPGTMGSPYHHYIIADPWIIPPESELYYSEKVVRLPCYQPNDRKRVVAPERPTRAQAGLPDDAFVFCCFNGPQKITRFNFERWLEILQRTPGSVLWLLDSSGEATNERLRAYAEARGVARDRLVFAPKQPNALHLARYPLADLFLDTTPYGAHTTASDALWMGVPVLTLSGRGFASRVCGSLVRSAGLAGLVCTTPSDYVERAVALANDRPAIAAYKAKLEEGRATSVLFDMDALVASLEGLFSDMAADHQRGARPRPDLTNLEAYLAVGVEIDHEAVEMLTVEDYAGLYKARLAARHLARPLPADPRMWTAADIAAVEPDTFDQARAALRATPRRGQASGG
ncbi:MAG: N-acetylglucosamine transferase [Caulobacter sp.]|nr:N-acetylglucosamine transferase [Caulobacter sp.]